MSASPLPSELWRSIFRHAVHVTGLLDVDWNYEPEDRFWGGWDHPSGGPYIEIVMRRTIVLVCREWRELGTELLYEVVSVPWYNIPDDYERLGNLVAIFKASTGGSASKHGHGWWTKRIDCHIDLLATDHVEHLLSLLEHCHNLEILLVSRKGVARTALQIRLADILRSRFSHSLRRLELYLDESNVEAPINYSAVLPGVCLTTLGISMREPHLDHPLPPVFEHITTLSLYFPIVIRQPPPQWAFPRLKTLELINLGKADFPALRSFIERHHTTLINLRIETTESILPTLSELISGHPNVRTLTFDDQDLFNLGQIAREGGVRRLPMVGLMYLGVTRTRQGLGLRVKDGLEGIFEGMALPDLRVLRLLSERSPMLTEVETWQEVIEMCRDHNVRLDDLDGHLVVITPQSSEPATEI